MDATDERVLMPATPHDAVNAIMNDMQGPQGFLASLEDPSALLTYFINENEGCSSIVPAMDHTNHTGMQGTHDHAYSRMRTEAAAAAAAVAAATTSASAMVNTSGSYVNNSVSIQGIDIQMNNNTLGDGSHLMSHLTSHDNYMSQPAHTYSDSLLGCTSTSEANNSAHLFGGNPNSTMNRSHMPEHLASNIHRSSKESLDNSIRVHQNSIAVASKTHEGMNTKPCDNVKPKLSFNYGRHQSTHHENIAKSRFSQPRNPLQNQIVSQQSPSLQASRPAAVLNTTPASAELRTVITFKIVDQIMYQGQVVKETVFKEEEIVKHCGTVAWPECTSNNSPSGTRCNSAILNPLGAPGDMNCGDTSRNTTPNKGSSCDLLMNHLNSFSSERETNEQDSSKNVSIPTPNKNLSANTDFRRTAVENKIASKSSEATHSNTLNSVKRRVSQDSQSSKRGKTKEDTELDSEEARRETASALLSLQGNQAARNSKCATTTLPRLQSDPEFRPITQGARVLAKWTDKNFYPGVVASFQGDSRWLVHFDDGGKRTIHENEIISVPYLSAGNKVMVTYSPGYCSHGVITCVEVKEDNNVSYTVEYYEGERKVRNRFSSGDIFLTPDIASWLIGRQNKSCQSSEFAGVDLNNIIPKTARVSKQTTNTETSEVNNVDNQNTVIRNVQTKKEKKSSAGPCDRGDSSDGSLIVAKQSKIVNKEPATTANQTGSSSGNSLRSINSISKTLPPAELEKLLGPLPREGSQLFKGIGFLLATEDIQPFGETLGQDAGKSTLLDVPYLIKQIEAGSGRYFETFEEKQNARDIKETVLIAYTYSRTVEYMQCLAAGIPCVTHTWVVDCCRENHLLKKEGYLLPSGYSIIHNKLFSDRNVLKKSPTVFKGTKVMFAPSKSKLAEKWTSVLTAANATVITSLQTSSGTSTRKASNTLDLIIGDSSCPTTLVTKAQQLKIPIVSTEYIVQCLIHGRKLPTDAHEKFHFNSMS